MKFYNNEYVKRIISGATGLVLLMGANSYAKADVTLEIIEQNGQKQTIIIPDGASLTIDGASTSGNTVAPTNDSFVATNSELSYSDYQNLCNDQYNEIIRLETEIARVQIENYRMKDFELNKGKLQEFIKAFVYITNHQLFDADAKAAIINNDITTDLAELIGNDYNEFTNFVNTYNQSILREQEVSGSFDKSKLISCEYSFGQETDRNEYKFATDTLFDSVKNGRVWNDDFYTLYCYISMYSGAGLNTNYLGNASLGAKAGIYRTVGQDFKESFKVIFDEYMADRSNKEKFLTYFEDIVTYKLKDDAKAEILINAKQANQENDKIALDRENDIFNEEPTDLCNNLDTLVFYYAHILDNVDDFREVMGSLNNEFGSKTK